MINAYETIAPCFWDVLDDTIANGHREYWLKGGRSSTKSSFIAIAIILNMMIDASNGVFSNCMALRKVENTVSGSVFNTMIWATEILGVSSYWKMTRNPMVMTYTPTGQQILFKGCDDPRKVKSTKFRKGYCKYIWFEELDEFYGMEDIRSIKQSLMRGGDFIKVFYSYNPPKIISNWVNSEAMLDIEGRLVHHSTYLDVPKEWLSEDFLIEAEILKKQNELYYRNEYMGEATGTGGQVFDNLDLRSVADKEIKTFDNILDGLDFGFAVDPSAYIQGYYDKTRRKLVIFNEIYKVGLSNRQLADEIKEVKRGSAYITCDSAEPKSIAELKSLALRVKPAKKGVDSIDYGIKFLQKLTQIVIDPKRCPNTAREFKGYAYDIDKNGNFISRYPDRDNHSIDAVRYMIEDYTIANTWVLSNRKLM